MSTAAMLPVCNFQTIANEIIFVTLNRGDCRQTFPSISWIESWFKENLWPLEMRCRSFHHLWWPPEYLAERCDILFNLTFHFEQDCGLGRVTWVLTDCLFLSARFGEWNGWNLKTFHRLCEQLMTRKVINLYPNTRITCDSLWFNCC